MGALKFRKICMAVLLGSVLLGAGSGCGQGDGPEFVVADTDAYTFSDGEHVSVGSFLGDSKLIYRLEDGTELLGVEKLYGPEHAVVEGVEPLQALSDTAQAEIAAFYEGQGALYDVEEYLVQAYGEYGSTPSGFRCYLLSQETVPSGTSERVFYCTTRMMLPLGRGEYNAYALTRAFDRESGRPMDGWELFSGQEDEIREVVLSAYTEDEKTMGVLWVDFRPEYIRFHEDGYEVIFPPETAGRLNIKGNIGFSGTYTEEILSVMHGWAVPWQQVEN